MRTQEEEKSEDWDLRTKRIALGIATYKRPGEEESDFLITRRKLFKMGVGPEYR